MRYHMLFSDIDGTLRPGSLSYIPLPNVEAIRAIQKYGVKFAIATGRGRAGIPDALLNGLEPDYWVCAAGAQVLDRDGSAIADSRMGMEELEALVSFCERNDYPLVLHFADGPVAYTGYDRLRQAALARGQSTMIRDGGDRRHHLAGMPFSASAFMPREAEARFQAEYGSLALRFPYYSDAGCDILRPGQDKSLGLASLTEYLGLCAEECVSVGDGSNDVGILRAAGLSFCVEGGEPDALAAADRICPSAAECGVAAVCRMVWPEAFE